MDHTRAALSFPSRPSAAIKIVAPTTKSFSPTPSENGSASTSKSSPKKDFAQRQCRNVLIHGSCKLEGKGCVYYHPPREKTPQPPSFDSNSQTSPQLSVHVNAPVFVPKGSTFIDRGSPPKLSLNGGNTATPLQRPGSTASAATLVHNSEYDPYDPYDHSDAQVMPPQLMEGLHISQADFNSYVAPQGADYNGISAMDSYYSPHKTNFIRQPLNYHLYSNPIPPNPQASTARFFVSDSTREELQKRSETIYASVSLGTGVPEDVAGYHSLSPLEPTGGERRKSFGNWHSTVYRAIKATDGITYALRRVESFRLVQEAAFKSIDAWTRIRHPNIVAIREAFTTRSFNDSSLVVVYDFHPNASTLFDTHIRPKPLTYMNGRIQPQNAPIPERVIWTYLIQLANAIKTVHDAGLAIRTIDATKVLLTGKNRIRISSCGVWDVLSFEPRRDLHLLQLQQEDLLMFGRLMLSLCCQNLAAYNNFHKSMETMQRSYSSDLNNVILFLVSPGPPKEIGNLFNMIGSRLLTEMDSMQYRGDVLENELMAELENGRLVRLLCKFGFINERPEFDHEPRWSETGDRYIIRLFRDYVFHQVDENGNPVVNLSHVLTCLNKLDVGSDERIMLVSRDEQSCLVVSYKEIKSCISTAFSDLTRGSTRP
ncbi:hypothetical protein SISSUDRAFT_1048869 [Sistotremastrum suecicum HHB10207 ss-3]|uniref:PAN2-PAN3 deadenylation complex subunit PAN3 n=1 Tax=Sistotremastrum suecicum HHB10207 ss-3 TaxID=1314776 RepID=A0A166C6E4_9AGAM|nr:hypothetical protein SISSUDRAFT_1048869 [Sistotremastrum suecicum HHB10207 ss-3]